MEPTMNTHNLTGSDLDLTILIPTHEREKHLNRSISYFKKFPIPVVYADSSKKKYDGLLPDNIRYFYYSHNEGLFEKILFSLDEIDTQFVALCADDDFLLYSGLVKGTEFLRDNPSYKTVSGKIYLFKEHFDGTFYEFYRTSYNKDINKNSGCNARLYFGDYFQTVWAIHEKEKLKKIASILSEKQWENLAIPEIIVGAINCFEGGIRVLPNIWEVREYLKNNVNMTKAHALDNDNNEFKQFKEIIDKYTVKGYADLIVENINCYYFNFLTNDLKKPKRHETELVNQYISRVNPIYWRKLQKFRKFINKYRANYDWISLDDDEITEISAILKKNV